MYFKFFKLRSRDKISVVQPQMIYSEPSLSYCTNLVVGSCPLRCWLMPSAAESSTMPTP